MHTDEMRLGRRLLNLLPKVDSSKRAEVMGDPLPASAFNNDSIDIYTNTLCHGSGTEKHPKLCTYCFLSTAQLKDKTMMSLDSVGKILTWAKGKDTVSLLGGEFSLHPDAKKIMELVYSAGFNMHIVTSGSPEFRELLQDNEVVAMLRDKTRDNLVAVSLDSVNEPVNDRNRGEGATQNALATIDALTQPGREISFRINSTPTRTVINDGVLRFGGFGGLEGLYDFARERGAREVLVHFPSPVGRGEFMLNQRLRDDKPGRAGFERPVQSPTGDTPGDWDEVMEYARDYNNQYGDADFRVEVENGYGLAMNCPLIEQNTSLQFAPPINPSNPDLPVVACGLNMSRAKDFSAFIFREGSLYRRAGQSELSEAVLARNKDGLKCPFQQDRDMQCIYDRTERSHGQIASI